MLSNYVKIAFRNIKRQKAYSFINIAGLALGIACALLILLWIQDELSYDRFHVNADDIYRLVAEGNNVRYAISHAPIASTLKAEYPEILNATRVSLDTNETLINYEDKKFESKGKLVDPDFFEIFSLVFISGNPSTAFSDPFSIVLTEDLAEKCFSDEDPIGKILTVDHRHDFTVTGVIKNVPSNSHLKFDFLRSFEYWKVLGWSSSWSDWSYYTYVLIQHDAHLEEVNQKINDCYEKYNPERKTRYEMQPLTRVHLYSDLKFDVEGNGDIQYVYVFTVIAIMILVIACINFMNLSTARSAGRAREVSIRKIVGSKRIQLVAQFFCESFLLALISFLIALLLVKLLLPIFSALSGKSLSIALFDNFFILISLAIIFVCGITAGSYPAILLSSFSPLDNLRGTLKSRSWKIIFRKILVVAQFSISIGLIISTAVVYKQTRFMRNAKLGFEKENLVYMRLRGNLRENFEILKSELLQHPNTLNVSASSHIITDMLGGTDGAEWEGKEEGDNLQMQILRVDYDFFDTYKTQMAQGRFFSKEFSTDGRESVILNETAIKAMAMESPIGKRFRYEGRDCKIIGVVKDFHFKPLGEEIEPLIVELPDNNRYNFLTVRMKSMISNFSGSLRFFKNLWNKHAPDYPFEYHFLDESIDNLYSSQKLLSKILSYFTFLTLFIACLGLFGLASFTAEQRTKEIGVRKVLGASVSGIVILLTSEYTKWVLLANIFAWPIAWYAMNKWLLNFAYRINIGLWTFLLAGTCAMMISLLTVSYQAVRVAGANPVEALRNE